MKIRPGAGAFKAALMAMCTGLFFALAAYVTAAEIPMGNLDFSDAAVKRGEAAFTSSCQTCHSLKYMGFVPRMDEANAQKAFGKVPPDLSLMAMARGTGTEGARYIYSLLVGFNDTPAKNAVFPNIAMPAPFAKDDPELLQEAKDVSAFLFHAADPAVGERKWLGKLVLGYMIILSGLLYFLYRKTWRRLKNKRA
jgi:ubiquinol-cytochrome c reductase cytochrome c1 subunit